MSDYTLHEGFPNIRLQEGMQLKLNAIDPVTGDEVAGVIASRWSIYGDDNSDSLIEDVVPVYSLEGDGESEGLGTPSA